MTRIEKATVQIQTGNRFYQTIVNAKFSDQTTETLRDLGKGKQDEWTYEYELSDHILVILWK